MTLLRQNIENLINASANGQGRFLRISEAGQLFMRYELKYPLNDIWKRNPSVSFLFRAFELKKNDSNICDGQSLDRPKRCDRVVSHCLKW